MADESEPRGNLTPEQELKELQRKIAVLESDRKAFFDSSQATIRQNKELILAAKQEYKDLRTAVQSLSKEHGGGSSATFQDQEIDKLNIRINQLKQKYDELKYERDAKQQALAQLTDKLQEFQQENQPVLDDDSPLTRQIRMLENRLDKAMIKYNEAMSIRKTYEQIVKRLRDERVGFDNQLAAIEKTLKAKEHDYGELMIMSHDANHARDVAKAELSAFREQLIEERKAREKELFERKQFVQQRVEMAAKMEKREAQRRKAELERMGDHDKEDEEKLVAAAYAQQMQNQMLEHRIEEEQERISAHEEAFRKIKEATGVTDVNEVIQKFMTQEETYTNLQEMTREAQQKIDQLSDEKAELKSRLEELKYSGSASLGSRRIVDEFEAHLAEATASSERNRQKHDRIARILVNVKAGVGHLTDKMNVIRLEMAQIPVTDELLVDALAQCEQKLLKLMESLAESDLKRGVRPGSSAAAARTSSTSTGLSGGEKFAHDIPQNNTRIRLPTTEEAEEDDATNSEGDDQILDRAQIKKTATLAVEKQTTKKTKSKGKPSKGKDSDGDN